MIKVLGLDCLGVDWGNNVTDATLFTTVTDFPPCFNSYGEVTISSQVRLASSIKQIGGGGARSVDIGGVRHADTFVLFTVKWRFFSPPSPNARIFLLLLRMILLIYIFLQQLLDECFILHTGVEF